MGFPQASRSNGEAWDLDSKRFDMLQSHRQGVAERAQGKAVPICRRQNDYIESR